jgi:hypothetical protein
MVSQLHGGCQDAVLLGHIKNLPAPHWFCFAAEVAGGLLWEQGWHARRFMQAIASNCKLLLLANTRMASKHTGDRSCCTL